MRGSIRAWSYWLLVNSLLVAILDLIFGLLLEFGAFFFFSGVSLPRKRHPFQNVFLRSFSHLMS